MLTALLLAAAASTGVPAVDLIEPATLHAYQPVELAITGRGFSADCKVLIGTTGRMVPVRHDRVDDTEIRVRLTAGYGPNPPRRQVVVDCGRNRRSAPSMIEIVSGSPKEPETPLPAEHVPIGPTDGSEAPVITTLDPANVGAGRIITLTIMGSGFDDGAEVEIFANSNAGSSRNPAYEMVRFPADVASDTVLLVDLDRGFAPSPRLRQVAVVNPNGKTSAPVYLEIKRSSP